MAYVLATVPNMMESAGLNKHVMFTVLILLVILTTCAMAFYTNRPFALAPGLGSVGKMCIRDRGIPQEELQEMMDILYGEE